MFEHFSEPTDLFRYRLGSALTMEHDSLDMLGELEMAAQSQRVKQMFLHHAEETKEQIQNLERIFELLGFEKSDEASPTTKGLAKEGSSLIRKSDPQLIDEVALSAALGTEHYEISAYQTLIASAKAMGQQEVQALLERNLEQEQHTSEELHGAVTEMAARV